MKTPKEDRPENSWSLCLPNINAAGVCIGAIVYGLSKDWNPYSLLMAGFALWQALNLGSCILLGQQLTLHRVRNRLFRVRNWILWTISIRHGLARTHQAILSVLRERAVIVVIILIGLIVAYSLIHQTQSGDLLAIAPPEQKEMGGFYLRSLCA